MVKNKKDKNNYFVWIIVAILLVVGVGGSSYIITKKIVESKSELISSNNENDDTLKEESAEQSKAEGNKIEGDKVENNKEDSKKEDKVEDSEKEDKVEDNKEEDKVEDSKEENKTEANKEDKVEDNTESESKEETSSDKAESNSNNSMNNPIEKAVNAIVNYYGQDYSDVIYIGDEAPDYLEGEFYIFAPNLYGEPGGDMRMFVKKDTYELFEQYSIGYFGKAGSINIGNVLGNNEDTKIEKAKAIVKANRKEELQYSHSQMIGSQNYYFFINNHNAKAGAIVGENGIMYDYNTWNFIGTIVEEY